MKIKIADYVFEFDCYYDLGCFFRNYLSNGQPDFSFSYSFSEVIDLMASDKYKPLKEIIVSENRILFEETVIYRHITDILSFYDTILFHGSVVSVDGEGYMFTAKSGVGKSTQSRLWKEFFGERAVIVNDDKPLIKLINNGMPYVYGTPWSGKYELNSNISVPLKAICIIRQSRENSISRVSVAEYYGTLLQQCYQPVLQQGYQ